MVLLASLSSYMVLVWLNYHWLIGLPLLICLLSMELPWVSSLWIMSRHNTLTGRSDDTVALIEGYLCANKMFIDYSEPQTEKVYSSCLELDHTHVLPCVSGLKRPHD